MTLEAAAEIVGERFARHGQICEGDGGIHHVGRPHRVGFRWEGQSSAGELEFVASYLELGRVRDAFVIGNRNVVQTGLNGAGRFFPDSLGACSH